MTDVLTRHGIERVRRELGLETRAQRDAAFYQQHRPIAGSDVAKETARHTSQREQTNMMTYWVVRTHPVNAYLPWSTFGIGSVVEIKG